jgi:hypothetical protein
MPVKTGHLRDKTLLDLKCALLHKYSDQDITRIVNAFIP